MDSDSEEFFTAIGCIANSCKELLTFTVTNQETGEIIFEDMKLTCGLYTTSTGDPRLECRFCHRFGKLCTCGKGIALGSMADPTAPICSDDEFCHRDKMTHEYLERLEEEEDFGDKL